MLISVDILGVRKINFAIVPPAAFTFELNVVVLMINNV